MGYILAMICLFVCGLRDIKKKKIPVLLLGFILFISLIYFWAMRGQEEKIPGMVNGWLPGMVLLILAFASHQIGYGDAVAAVILGNFLGMKETLYVLFFASIICSLVGVMEMIRKKKEITTRIAFIPFMCIGVVITYITSII